VIACSGIPVRFTMAAKSMSDSRRLRSLMQGARAASPRILHQMKYPHPIVYELSSAHDVVRWAWMRQNNRRVIFFAQPTVSAEEYERQMQALLSLIAAKTGLPLYDLR